MPHTADLRIEAWAPTRDGCIRQAVLGTVESFLDLESAHAVHTRLRRLTADRDDDLLVAVLEEVIYLLDTVGETPVDLRLRDVDGGVDVTFATTDASTAQSQPRCSRTPCHTSHAPPISATAARTNSRIDRTTMVASLRDPLPCRPPTNRAPQMLPVTRAQPDTGVGYNYGSRIRRSSSG